MDARWVCATCKSEFDDYDVLFTHVVKEHGWDAER